jgi:hypothetical protein
MLGNNFNGFAARLLETMAYGTSRWWNINSELLLDNPVRRRTFGGIRGQQSCRDNDEGCDGITEIDDSFGCSSVDAARQNNSQPRALISRSTRSQEARLAT